MRMYTASSMIENGFVHIPENAPWLPEYMHEMSVFDNGKYDDQVDSTSQALNWVKAGSYLCFGLLEYFKPLRTLCMRPMPYEIVFVDAEHCYQGLKANPEVRGT
jgi:hypothetical protein